MISLKKTLKALAQKINSIGEELNARYWYLDYANQVSIANNFTSYTAPSTGVILCEYNGTSSLKVAYISVNGAMACRTQLSSVGAISPMIAFVKKGDVVTTYRENTSIHFINCRFVPIKWGGVQ